MIDNVTKLFKEKKKSERKKSNHNQPNEVSMASSNHVTGNNCNVGGVGGSEDDYIELEIDSPTSEDMRRATENHNDQQRPNYSSSSKEATDVTGNQMNNERETENSLKYMTEDDEFFSEMVHQQNDELTYVDGKEAVRNNQNQNNQLDDDKGGEVPDEFKDGKMITMPQQFEFEDSMSMDVSIFEGFKQSLSQNVTQMQLFLTEQRKERQRTIQELSLVLSKAQKVNQELRDERASLLENIKLLL